MLVFKIEKDDSTVFTMSGKNDVYYIASNNDPPKYKYFNCNPRKLVKKITLHQFCTSISR